MVSLLRRYLVLIALMFWQGGFTFYAAVVVPVGTEVLGGATFQGFITRHVTKYLNLAGAGALVLLALDVAACRGERSPRRLLRWLCWAGMALTLALLAWLHPQLDALMDPVKENVRDRATFRAGHRVYLWTSTVQWGFGLGYALLTLWGWRDEDRASPTSQPASLPKETSAIS